MPHLAIQQQTTCSYEVTGPSSEGAALVVALGGISATKHVTTTDEDRTPGWWNSVVGQGRAVDTSVFRVFGLDYLDGGVTPDGRPARTISTHDQADALVQALDELEIARVHTLIGASYGGMVALAFAERYPERVERLVVISAAARPHPMSTARRAIQRRIVELGLETGRAFDAMVIARALAMTTYRSPEEFSQRFSSHPEPWTGEGRAFPVENYLLHQGDKFAHRFSPARFLALSLSCDLHRVEPQLLRTPALLVSAEGDSVVPREQMLDLAARWAGPCELVHVPTLCGHDAFLAEPDAIGGAIRNALNSLVLS